MEKVASKSKEPCSLVVPRVSENKLAFYRRFVERHGGAFVPLERNGEYRLDFPPGTRRLHNKEFALSLRESYLLLYPDGIRLIWYRRLLIDGQESERVLLFPINEEDLTPCEINAPSASTFTATNAVGYGHS